MSESKIGAALRLERLERVLRGRRARLASALAGQRRRSRDPGPLGSLQRYGYPVALLLALTAVLPKMVGFTFRHRKLLFGAAANGLGLWKLRRKFDSARRSEGSR